MMSNYFQKFASACITLCKADSFRSKVQVELTMKHVGLFVMVKP